MLVLYIYTTHITRILLEQKFIQYLFCQYIFQQFKQHLFEVVSYYFVSTRVTLSILGNCRSWANVRSIST